MKVSLIDKIEIRLRGFKDVNSPYGDTLMKCKKHGYIIAIEHGHYRKYECPKCKRENR